MRVCIPELLQARGLSAYMLALRSNGRISESTAYRLVEMNGELQTYGADILAALLEVLDVTPNVLFGWEPLPIGTVATAPKGRKKTAAQRRRVR